MNYAGTGSKMADFGSIRVVDDGYSDCDVEVQARYDGKWMDVCDIRYEMQDDDEFIDLVEMAFGTDPEHTSDHTVYSREPPASKCEVCNKTYPRTMLTEGVCDDCNEGDTNE